MPVDMSRDMSRAGLAPKALREYRNATESNVKPR